MDFRTILQDQPLLAILRGIPEQDLLPYTQAILRGGVRFLEIPLNSPHALDQISLLRQEFGDQLLLGAGTAITVERAQAAMAAGAQFLLTPSSDIDVLAWCREHNVSIIPGALTPTDVSTCLRYGFDVIKLFPAGDMPPNYIRSLKGPFDTTDYIAFGGIRMDNLAQFMAQGYLGVGISSGLLPAHAAQSRDWDAVAAHISQLTNALHQYKKTGV